MTEYLRNTETELLIENENLGKSFVPPLWVDATQEEVDAYLLEQAKFKKIGELNVSLGEYLNAGYNYDGNSFQLTDQTIENIQMKNSCPSGMSDRYKFCDMDHILVDFGDASVFVAFLEALFAEKDRVMVKDNAYKVAIAACETVAAVDAIVIDFSS